MDITIAKSKKFVASCSHDKKIILWDLHDKNNKTIFKGHTGSVTCIHFMPDDNYLISSSYDKTLKIWNIISQKQERSINMDYYINKFCIIPSKNFIVCACEDHKIRMQNLSLEKCEEVLLEGHNDKINSLCLSKDEKLVISSSGFFSNSEDNSIRVWNIENTTEKLIIKGEYIKIQTIIFSPYDSNYIISGSTDNSIRIWDISRESNILILSGHTNIILCIYITNDSKFIISSSLDYTIRLWDIRINQAIHVFQVNSPARVLCGTLDSSFIFSGSVNGNIRCWNIKEKKEDFLLEGHLDEITCLKLTSIDRFLISSSLDKTLILWNLYEKNQHCVYNIDGLYIDCFILTKDNHFFIYSSDLTIKVRDLSKKQQIANFQGHKSKINGLILICNGKYLISSSFDNTIRVWNLSKKKLLGIIDQNLYDLYGIAISINEMFLASCFSNKIRVYYLQEEVIKLKIYDYRMKFKGDQMINSYDYGFIPKNNALNLQICSSWSKEINLFPKEKLIIAECKDSTYRIWNFKSRKQIIATRDSEEFKSTIKKYPEISLFLNFSND